MNTTGTVKLVAARHSTTDIILQWMIYKMYWRRGYGDLLTAGLDCRDYRKLRMNEGLES